MNIWFTCPTVCCIDPNLITWHRGGIVCYGSTSTLLYSPIQRAVNSFFSYSVLQFHQILTFNFQSDSKRGLGQPFIESQSWALIAWPLLSRKQVSAKLAEPSHLIRNPKYIIQALVPTNCTVLGLESDGSLTSFVPLSSETVDEGERNMFVVPDGHLRHEQIFKLQHSILQHQNG